jgi:hypothetical protein
MASATGAASEPALLFGIVKLWVEVSFWKIAFQKPEQTKNFISNLQHLKGCHCLMF